MTEIARWRPRIEVKAQDSRLRASLVMDKVRGVLSLPRGDRGPQGDPGPDSRPWTLVDIAYSADALPTDWTLADRKKAIALIGENKIAYWTGSRWVVGGNISYAGDANESAAIAMATGSVATIAPGGEASATLTPRFGGYNLNLGLVRGNTGATGPTGVSNQITGATGISGTFTDGKQMQSQGGQWVPGNLSYSPIPPYPAVGDLIRMFYFRHWSTPTNPIAGAVISTFNLPSWDANSRVIVSGSIKYWDRRAPDDNPTIVRVMMGGQQVAFGGRKIEAEDDTQTIEIVPYTDPGVGAAHLIAAETNPEFTVYFPFAADDGHSSGRTIQDFSITILQVKIGG